MENGTDRYLHKKFKKQLSIEPRTNKLTATDQTRINDSVPTHSTNSVNVSVLNYVIKSSISNNLVTNGSILDDRYDSTRLLVERELEGDINPYGKQSADISYVKVSVSQTEPTNFVTTTSSILNEFYTPVTISNYNENSNSELPTKPEITAQQDKSSSSGGKYVCTYCNLACSKPSVLQKHIRAHTNERPYPCVSCGFSFKTRSNLYKHCRSRTHANKVMGNKAQEISSEVDGDSQSKSEIETVQTEEIKEKEEPVVVEVIKAKPYKPRFHTAKTFYDSENLENSPQPNNAISNNEKHSNPELLSLHINDLIDKNNSIVNTTDPFLLRRRTASTDNDCLEVPYNLKNDFHQETRSHDEPLNLTNKNRKRCLSEVSEPATHKSLIKELLLKNLYADSNMQCPHCKMIFQTVTELELHKMRNCKGLIKTGPRYSRSSSVNVASILTQNKNAFDNIPHLQNAVFPLKSPGPFLGKTRLVESDKTKSFSYEDGIQFPNESVKTPSRYSLSPLTLSYDKAKKNPVKLFGGEVKITQTSGETKSFKIDGKETDKYHNDNNYMEFGGKLSENRVVKSTLQSGGTVLQNKPNYNKQESLRTSPDVIRVYENTSVSPSIDISNLEKTKFHFDNRNHDDDRLLMRKPKETWNGFIPEAKESILNLNNKKYTNIMDFSQSAAKLLVPNLKQLNLTIPGLPMPTKFIETSSPLLAVSKKYDNLSKNYEQTLKIDTRQQDDYIHKQNLSPAQTPTYYNKFDEFHKKPKCVEQNGGILNPVNLFVNGKVVRYVPGMPGPVIAETNPTPIEHSVITTVQKPRLLKPNIMITPVDTPPIKEDERLKKMEILEVKTELHSPKPPEMRSPILKSPNKSPNLLIETPRKFARPNSLALKPTMSSLKQHHGLTPTMFNQILISPDTPRGAKKYNEHFLHGNYFSYLGLKSSTKPVYCTVNKTQPFYVPHFKKLSMYSEWRQQDNKSDKLYVSGYDSRQKSNRYTTSGKYDADYVVHSSYKFTIAEVGSTKDENQKTNSILGGYESNEDYTYVRGRGRGRYVCDQCGIRCKKPSMLKKHIRTHSNDRPYTCKHCNFSFKTKGNLTKHMKSKAHTKNYAANSNGSSSSAQQSGTPSSDSETEDSGMDSSDESSTRQQEHEAAYGLLSLSQKPASTVNLTTDITSPSSVSSNLSPISNTDVTTATSFINTEQLVQVSKTNYAKNKILDQQKSNLYNTSKLCDVTTSTVPSEDSNHSLSQYFGRTTSSRPLTYPYTTVNTIELEKPETPKPIETTPEKIERKNIQHFNVIKRYNSNPTVIGFNHRKTENVAYNDNKINREVTTMPQEEYKEKVVFPQQVIESEDLSVRKRKLISQDTSPSGYKLPKSDSEVMDLSMAQNEEKSYTTLRNGIHVGSGTLKLISKAVTNNLNGDNNYVQESIPSEKDNRINVNYIMQESSVITDLTNRNAKTVEYDNSAMETLADIATKQEKLEKNSMAKNVATEFLKLATKNDNGDDKGFVGNNKDVNDMVKTEENKSCTICSKNFSKPSQLRLHMNIHYLERPFRCDSCSVSFRTKGHLQKHERSASHHNKLSSSPALASSEPRPFKCSDCNIAFRIHGHLAKHLRSKMHIMKLECLAKIPFGLYAELERSNSLLTEINTADGDQCLDSLKILAKKVFMNDPSKLIQLDERNADQIETDTDS